MLSGAGICAVCDAGNPGWSGNMTGEDKGELLVMNNSKSCVRDDSQSVAEQPLDNLMKSAWDIRLANFKSDIEWVNPIRTAVLSVTGTECALKCAHCGGKYLKHMLPVERWRELNPSEISSCLISGGCDTRGKFHWMSIFT